MRPAAPLAEAALQQHVEIDADPDRDCALPAKYDIIASPVDYPLEALHRMMASHDIVLPELPRRRAWDLRTASRFIESFAMGLPVPPVYLLEQKDRAMLAIDGLQRLQTIRGFFDGRFWGGEAGGPGAREFRLAGVGKGGRLHGRTFSGLDPDDRRALENAVLRAVVVRQMHPDENPLVVHDLFERLNTGGTSLRDQEVRHCAYPGRLSGLISELNGAAEWRGLLGSPRRDGRMRDAELILRYMALLHAGGDYRRPMKAFLSEFMHKNRDPADAFVYEERARFARACGILRNRLGRLPLDGSGRISPPVFDAIFVSVARSPDDCDDPGLGARVRDLLSDPAFAECAAGASTDPPAVRRRLSLAGDRLRG